MHDDEKLNEQDMEVENIIQEGTNKNVNKKTSGDKEQRKSIKSRKINQARIVWEQNPI